MMRDGSSINSNLKRDLLLSLWKTLLIAAHLFSLISSEVSINHIWGIQDPPDPVAASFAVGVILFGVAGLFVRSSSVWLSVMIAFFIAVVGWDLPEIPNHRFLLILFDLVYLAYLLSPKSFGLSGAMPFVGWLVSIVYFFAAVAKLNYGYLGIESCIDDFFSNIDLTFEVVFGLRPLAMISPFNHRLLGLILELAFPFLLLLKRTRKFGLFLALGFHTLLALDPVKRFFNFSSVMVLGLAAFALRNRQEVASNLVSRCRWSVRNLRLMVLLAVSCALLLPGLFPQETTRMSLQFIIAIGAWLIGYLPVCNYLIREPVRQQLYRTSWIVKLVSAFAITLAIINGMAPYLGLKTRNSFTMYSDLKLDRESSNHLIVPRSLNLLGLMDQRVEVIDSNSYRFNRRWSSGVRMYYYEFWRTATYEYPDKIFTFRFLDSNNSDWQITGDYYPRLTPPKYAAWRKLIIFHPIKAESLCLW